MKSTYTALCALLLALFGGLTANAGTTEPYYDTVGNISLSGDVTQSTLQQWKPYTFEMTVPPDRQSEFAGFNTGFGILVSDNERGVTLDSMTVIEMSFSLYHLDVQTGVETPVHLPNGADAVNIAPVLYTRETGISRPCVFTLDGSHFNGNPSSPNQVAITNTMVPNVGALCATKQNIRWGTPPDLTRPTLNKGYVIRWKIRFNPTYGGIGLSTKTVNVSFVYKVGIVPLPELVSVKSGGPNGGMLLQYKGTDLEWFCLKRSKDLVTWTPWSFEGEGSQYLGNGVFQWEIFDPAFPNDRFEAPREFFKMEWCPERGFWRIEPPSDQPE